MSLTALLLFAVTLFVVAATPGASVAALVARVLTHGVRDVLPFLAAMWLGEGVWLTIAVAGIAVVAQSFAHLFTMLRWAGAAYLLWLAWKMWRAPVAEAAERLPKRQRPWRMFWAGMMVSLGNPKVMVFYLALLPTFVDLRAMRINTWLELLSTMLLVLAAADLGWAVIASRARRLLSSRRAVRIANRTSAGVMVGAAVAVASG